VDPRGIGDSRPSTCGDDAFLCPYGSDYLYAATGEMLGESLLGRRVHDVLCSIDFLLENGAEEVRLAGRGLGSITAAFAALIHPERPRVRLLDYLPSYESLIRDDLARWPLSTLLRGVLRHFDLPDVYRALQGRLTRERPWDPVMTERKR
jgi:pimeloyl-ACP methyl ester carboxylesterase